MKKLSDFISRGETEIPTTFSKTTPRFLNHKVKMSSHESKHN